MKYLRGVVSRRSLGGKSSYYCLVIGEAEGAGEDEEVEPEEEQKNNQEQEQENQYWVK